MLDKINKVGVWAAIALGFTLPISVALDNLLTLVMALAWALGGFYAHKLGVLRGNRVVYATLILFGLMILGCLYGMGTRADALHYLGKYQDLAYVPLLIPLFAERRHRSYAVYAFMASMTVTLAASFLLAAGVIPAYGVLEHNAENPVVFKLHITQSIFMGFAAYLFALHALEAGLPRRLRLGAAAMALVATFNVLFMTQGRTGYLVVGALLAYLLFVAWTRLDRRKAAAVAVCAALLGVAGYFHSNAISQRIALASTELGEWKPGQGGQTSTGLRMDYWRNSLLVIKEHPLFGVGTGGFEKAYAQKVQGTHMAQSNNPHSQYILITTQLGIVGLAALLYLFWTQWRWAARLEPMECHMARGMLLTIAVGSLVNSLLLDHAEGLFFAWMTGILYAGLRAREA